jgi:CheY-like chemotaxis protein/HPt (histidine-containing phosphotransfer) domain-containing protein
MQHRSEGQFAANILVAEDNEINQDIAVRILENMGCKVSIAADGAIATRLLTQNKYDLVLMDCEMPGMDGFEATKRIREMEDSAERAGTFANGIRIPIIGLTAYASDEARARCLSAGMDDFLVKPLRKLQLLQAMQRWRGEIEQSNTEDEGSGDQVGEAIIDLSALDTDAFNGAKGAALLKRLVTHFCVMGPAMISRMREKQQAGDGEELWRLAHSLKSSAAALGAMHVSRCSAAIETTTKAQGTQTIAPMLDQLSDKLTIALKALGELVGEMDE